MLLAQLRLEVAPVKTMEHRVRHEQHQPQHQYAVGMVVEVMVGVPVGDQLVKPLVLDFPTVMPKCGDCLRSRQGLRHGRCPEPIGHNFPVLPSPCNAFPFHRVLMRPDDAQRAVDVFRGETLHVAQVDSFMGVRGGMPLQLQRLLGSHQGFGFREQLGLVGFEDGDEVFAMAVGKVYHRWPQVNGVGAQHIEKAGMVLHHTFEQAHCGAHLVLACPLQFQIQQQVEIPANELENHDAVVMLDPGLAADLKGALHAAGAAAVVA